MYPTSFKGLLNPNAPAFKPKSSTLNPDAKPYSCVQVGVSIKSKIGSLSHQRIIAQTKPHSQRDSKRENSPINTVFPLSEDRSSSCQTVQRDSSPIAVVFPVSSPKLEQEFVTLKKALEILGVKREFFLEREKQGRVTSHHVDSKGARLFVLKDLEDLKESGDFYRPTKS